MAVKKPEIRGQKSEVRSQKSLILYSLSSVLCSLFSILCLLFSVLYLLSSAPAWATTRQEVYVTATVPSFGGYTFTEAIEFTAAEPGTVEIGRITVEGLYNGEYPWILRVYTDNLHFAGVAGAVERPNPAGLISKDGRFQIPLEIQSPVFGPDEWRRIPDLNEAGYRPYSPPPLPEEPQHTDGVILGIDPRNANWVAGPDGLLYTEDDNPLGDWTAKTPFELVLRARIDPSTVSGSYDALLYLEIVPAP